MEDECGTQLTPKNIKVIRRGDIRDIVIKWAKRQLQSQDDLEEMTNEICALFNVALPGAAGSHTATVQHTS